MNVMQVTTDSLSGRSWVVCAAVWWCDADVSVIDRYLLHVFMEAGCLEWCVVVGLILRDASVIKQVVGFLDSPEVPPETVQSIRAGLKAVDLWASSDWSVSVDRVWMADLMY